MGNEFLFYAAIVIVIIIVLTIVISTWPQENFKEQFNDNKRNIIIRILGNDLNGLHGSNQTYNNLKFTLENEPQFENCDKMFILNRIIDKEKKQKYIELLNKYKTKYIEIPNINKSIELNSLKTLYANRFGTTTNMRKVDMQKALIKIWNKENKGVDKK